MSHMSKIELIINDLGVLEKACRYLKMEYSQDIDKVKKRGCAVESQALAVITILGARHVISVTSESDSVFRLRSALYDHDKDFSTITAAIGCLKQRYAVERIMAEARKKRMRIQEMATETGVRLVLTSY